MRASALLISWHNEKSPIYSVHFAPHGKGRLASAGGDNLIRLWNVETNGDERKVTYLATLSKHAQAVNVVRWSPKDELLASAGDDGTVIMWSQSEFHATNKFGEEDLDDEETWVAKRQCRSNTSHEYGIYDLAWSPDGAFFVTGSTDNVARIYDALTGNVVRQIADHNHYVQGVAWDPLNEYLATQSSDRSVHIYKLQTSDGQFALGQPTLYSRMARMEMAPRRPSSNSPAPPDFGHRSLLSAAADNQAHASMSPAPSAPGTPTSAPLPMDPPPPSSHGRKSSNSLGAHSPAVHRSPSPAPSMPLPAIMPPNFAAGLGLKNTNIYANEAFTSFFRRLTFAPDGSLLFTPAGQYKTVRRAPNDPSKTTDEIINTVYIYSRGGLDKPPIAHLPGHKKPSVAVRCSPVLYNLRLSAPTKHVTIDTSSAPGEDIVPLPGPVLDSKLSTITAMEPPPLTGFPSPAPSTTAQSPKPIQAEPRAPSEGPTPAFALPYRVVYAVATQDAVFVYDTQQQTPLCIVSNLHFATFTDLTWSNDGLTLLMSSSDGFCSSLSFSPGELGSVYQGPPRVKSHRPSAISVSNSTSSTPHPTPPIIPAVLRHPSSAGLGPSPSPMSHVRPASPTRSNSASSIATQSSFVQGSVVVSNPTPSVMNLPSVAASGSKPFIVPPPLTSPTPPLTPLPSANSGATSVLPSFSSSVGGSVTPLGSLKRDGDSQRNSEDGNEPKRRRVAPTLVSQPEAGNDGAEKGTGEKVKDGIDTLPGN